MYRTADTLRNHYLSATESWTLTFGYIRYGRSILTTTGLLVYLTHGAYVTSRVDWLNA